MKQSLKKDKKLTKGMPSAVVLSILIHAGLFLLAGMLVVFTVVKKEEQKFEPPKAIERPKMKLKKPKVKIKKTSKPKPTTRIVTKMNRANMPEIQLPEMSSMGDGLGGGGIGGFDMMPDLGEVTVFGGGQSIGNDFVGTFYDFKRDRQGGLIVADGGVLDKLAKFVEGGWKTSTLGRYYRSPKKLYTTSFMIPATLSSLGPRAFGEDTGGWTWMALYKGQLVYPEDIRFRFWGFGDDFLLVRVNGKLVLNGCWHNNGADTDITRIARGWSSTSSDDAMYWYGNNKARVGDWIELKAGEPLDMEVMIGEFPGGIFSAMLTVQVDGVDYPKNRQGGPILPMFATEEPSRELQDIIYSTLIQNEAAVTNGPIFRDYMVAPQTNQTQEVVAEIPESEDEEEKLRVWSGTDGKQFEAEYVSVIGGKAVLKTTRGKMLKIPKDKLSAKDREYIELIKPPQFTIDFVKLSNGQSGRYKVSPYNPSLPPRVNDFTFGAKLKQRSAGDYNHELIVEYFAIGKELLGDKYILLDRKSGTFTPTKENGRSHTFKGDPIEMIEYINEGFDTEPRGRRPDGNLVIITDERGQIIQYKASKSWLWENIDRLRELPVGAYMDKTCTRAYPTSPRPTKW